MTTEKTKNDPTTQTGKPWPELLPAPEKQDFPVWNSVKDDDRRAPSEPVRMRRLSPASAELHAAFHGVPVSAIGDFCWFCDDAFGED
jgi:hypothetical protein